MCLVLYKGQPHLVDCSADTLDETAINVICRTGHYQEHSFSMKVLTLLSNSRMYFLFALGKPQKKFLHQWCDHKGLPYPSPSSLVVIGTFFLSQWSDPQWRNFFSASLFGLMRVKSVPYSVRSFTITVFTENVVFENKESLCVLLQTFFFCFLSTCVFFCDLVCLIVNIFSYCLYFSLSFPCQSISSLLMTVCPCFIDILAIKR